MGKRAHARIPRLCVNLRGVPSLIKVGARGGDVRWKCGGWKDERNQGIRVEGYGGHELIQRTCGNLRGWPLGIIRWGGRGRRDIDLRKDL